MGTATPNWRHIKRFVPDPGVAWEPGRYSGIGVISAESRITNHGFWAGVATLIASSRTFSGSGVKSSPGLMNRSCSSPY
jgi:hypothetical protein